MRIQGTLVALGVLLATGSVAPTLAQRAAAPVIPNLAGKILTVLGPMEPSALGQTLMHEHILIDYKPLADQTPQFATPEAAAAYEQPLTLATLYQARYGQGLRMRKPIRDFDLARDEVMEFKKWGGHTVVDLSNIGLGRDPRAMMTMSQVTNLQIVMGAGWYARGYHPTNMDELTVEGMTDVIVHDIVSGAEGTTVRSGIIGEVGIDGGPLTANEIKSTRASARASRLTGAPMSFHSAGVGEEKLKVLDIVASEGVAMSNVVLGHSNSISDNFPLMKRLLDRGVFIEFDYLGLAPPPGSTMNHRNERPLLQSIVNLIKAGYGGQIVLGHDICANQQLKKFGGTGYSYINEFFLPELKRFGATDEDIRKIMIDNPRKALTFVAPKPMLATSTAAR